VVLGTFPISTGAAGLCFDGTNVWISGNTYATARPVDTTQPEAQYPVVDATAALFDGTYVWFTQPTKNQIYSLNSSGTPVFTLPVGHNPTALCTDGTYLYVLNTGDSTVSIVQVNASTGIATLVATTQPLLVFTTTPVTNATGIVCDGSNLWVLDRGTLNLLQITLPSLKTAATFAAMTCTYNVLVPPGASQHCFDGSFVWVVHNTGLLRVSVTDKSTFPFPLLFLVKPTSVLFDGVDLWIGDSGIAPSIFYRFTLN